MSDENMAARVAPTPRNDQLASFISTLPERELPQTVREAARQALVDYLGVAIGASRDETVLPALAVAQAWGAAGAGQIFLGGQTLPAVAAFVNATAAHAMDYDDTHPLGGGHPSGPAWSTVLALNDAQEVSESVALAAFLAGYEVIAKLGGGGPPGVGRSLQRAGFHPTSVFGRSGAAASAAIMLGLTPSQTAHALGVVATTAGGLLGSFGTYGKPFHAGKGAFDGILSAQLAANGFQASTSLYELDTKGGLLRSFLPVEGVQVPALDFGEKWEILGNSFKLFASCRGTHPSVQAAQSVAEKIGKRSIVKVHAKVHPNSLVAAGNMNPANALQGKFSLSFCIALGLLGYRLVASDFTQEVFRQPQVQALIPKIHCEGVPNQPNYESHMKIELDDGTVLAADIAIVIGHPDNPVSWDDLREKYLGLTEPVLGASRAVEVYELAREFDTQKGSLRQITRLLAA